MKDVAQSGTATGKEVEGATEAMPSYAELYALAFVPNQWQCDKCGFILMKSTINASTGQIGTSETDRQSEECPNDGEWMRPVTYKEVASSLQDRLLQEFEKAENVSTMCSLEEKLEALLVKWNTTVGLSAAMCEDDIRALLNPSPGALKP